MDWMHRNNHSLTLEQSFFSPRESLIVLQHFDKTSYLSSLFFLLHFVLRFISVSSFNIYCSTKRLYPIITIILFILSQKCEIAEFMEIYFHFVNIFAILYWLKNRLIRFTNEKLLPNLYYYKGEWLFLNA